MTLLQQRLSCEYILNYLKYLSEEIHSTVDEAGQPETCAIDVMDWDESGLYFLTARGKCF